MTVLLRQVGKRVRGVVSYEGLDEDDDTEGPPQKQKVCFAWISDPPQNVCRAPAVDIRLVRLDRQCCSFSPATANLGYGLMWCCQEPCHMLTFLRFAPAAPGVR